MKYLFVVVIASVALLGCKSYTNPSNDVSFEGAEATYNPDEEPFLIDTALLDLDWGDAYDYYDPYVFPVYHPSRTLTVDLIHTKIEASFNWEESQMNGKATISMKPHNLPIDSVSLDAKGMEIIAVEMNGKALSHDYIDLSKLNIRLGRTFTKSELITISIQYISKPEERIEGGSDAITSDKGLFFINPKGEEKDKMPQIWTQGETESNSVWFPTIDAPNVKSSEEVILTVEDKYTTLSNGKLISSIKNKNGTRTDHWKQDLPHAPYLFMLAVGEFKVVKDQYTRGDGKKIEVNYYVEPAYESSAKAIFGKTPKMIAFFSKKLGVEYPWDKYSEIVVRDYVSGAMENTGAVVFGDFLYKTKEELLDGNDESTIAHELFHHWFGDLVTCESWSNLPLNESFANYSQYLWDEYEYGLDEADYNAELEADQYYQAAGYHNLIDFMYEDKERMFDRHSYNKGGRILHMLRNYLGDETFFLGLNKYLTSKSFKSAEVHDLRLAFEEVSGEDLNWFFNQWFLAKGHPVIFTDQKIDQENHTVTLTVQQAQSFDLFRLPVKIALWDENGKHIHPVVLDSLTQSFTFPFSGKLNNLMLDDDQALLAKVYEEKPIEQYVHQLNNAARYRSKSIAIQRISKSDLANKATVLLAGLKDPFWGIRSTTLTKMANIKNLKEEKLSKMLVSIIEKDPKPDVRKEAFSIIGQLETKEALKIITNTIQKDSSGMVISAAFLKLPSVDSTEALRIARELIKHRNERVKVAAAELIGGLGTMEDYPLLENLILKETPKDFNQAQLIWSFDQFVYRNGTEALEKCLVIYSFLKENGNNYAKYYLDGSIEQVLGLITMRSDEIDQEIAESENQKEKLPGLLAEKQKLADLYTNLSPLLEVTEP